MRRGWCMPSLVFRHVTAAAGHSRAWAAASRNALRCRCGTGGAKKVAGERAAPDSAVGKPRGDIRKAPRSRGAKSPRRSNAQPVALCRFTSRKGASPSHRQSGRWHVAQRAPSGVTGRSAIRLLSVFSGRTTGRAGKAAVAPAVAAGPGLHRSTLLCRLGRALRCGGSLGHLRRHARAGHDGGGSGRFGRAAPGGAARRCAPVAGKAAGVGRASGVSATALSRQTFASQSRPEPRSGYSARVAAAEGRSLPDIAGVWTTRVDRLRRTRWPVRAAREPAHRQPHRGSPASHRGRRGRNRRGSHDSPCGPRWRRR